MSWWCTNLCNSYFLLKTSIESIQIKSNNESSDHISDLQDDETGSKKDADCLLDQELMSSDMMFSKFWKNDTSSNGKRKH